MYDIPILLLCFKRYEKTLEIFNVIKSVKPKKLYVSMDGVNNESEKADVEKVASIFDSIDWDCDFKIRKSDFNQGCKYGVYNGISWFFENEEYGIIIEDDILPFTQFFPYCKELLEKYKDDKRVACISGWSYFYNKREPVNYPYSYYFSHIQTSWGWATWRDRWQMIDLEIQHTNFDDIEKNLKEDGLPQTIIKYYKWIFDSRHYFESAWDYQFLFSVLMKNNMYCIQPIRRLVKNIGDMDGTHPTNVDHNKSLAIDNNFTLVHPPQFNYDPSIDILRNYQTNEYINL